MGGPNKTSRNEERLALGLGWFSIGLGLAELLAPRQLSRFLGVRTSPRLLQALGMREVATGLAILAQPRRSAWLKARVAGDALDLGLLGSAFGKTNAVGRLATATAAVTGVTLLDVMSSRALNRTDGAVETKRSITIGRPRQELYAVWRNFEQLPRFMKHLVSVRVNDSTHSHWVAKGPAGTEVEWDAEITQDEPNEVIAWRTAGDADLKHEGVVRFETARGDRGTVVRVEMRYWPPLGKAASKIAKLLGQAPEKQVRIDLLRFKQLMETGEIARTEGQSAGRSRSTSRLFDDLVRA